MEKIEDLIKLKQKQFVRANQRLNKLQQELQQMYKSCSHPRLESKENYFDGSYYDKASSVYWDECTLCGKTFNQRTVTYSYYG